MPAIPDARAAGEATLVRGRASRLVAGRVVIATALLGSATLLQSTAPGVFRVDPFFFLIGLAYALSVAYLSTLRYVERYPWLVDVQIWIDAVLVSAFILVTGGIRSDFSSLYLLPIIAASLLRGQRGALQVATLSACGYAAIVASQYVSLRAFPSWAALDPGFPPLAFAEYVLAINVSGFYAVALLAGSLADRLQTTGAQLVHASAAIEDLRQFNTHVIDSLVSGLVTTDADWRIVTYNKAAAAITGVSHEAAFGRDVREVLALPSEFGARLTGPDESRGRRADFSYRRPDGRAIEIGVTAGRLPFPDGRVGHLFTFQDVTDVKRLERDAVRRDRLAAVGEMAAGIAHEIRNPLASMSGSIQVLREELTLNEEQAELMDIVLRESDRLNQTIRSFLAYARPKPVAIGRCDLAQVVRDTARLLQNGADVRPEHRVDVAVPSAPVWCETDENQVRQILWNLATNGLRSMAAGGRLRVAVREGIDPPDEVQILVEDEGSGIAPGDMERIFQPFHSTFDRGTGLGLATVHRIVTELGGMVQVNSVVGQGTTMCVRLPRVAPTRPAGEPPVLQEAV